MAVTISDVRKVYTSSLTDEQLGVHLATAQLVVAEQLTGVSGCSMSEERLDMITIYLTAHFAEASEQGAAGDPGAIRREKIGEADVSYFIPGSMEGTTGYRTTRWGQLAIALDTCNILVTQAGKLNAQLRVV